MGEVFFLFFFSTDESNKTFFPTFKCFCSYVCSAVLMFPYITVGSATASFQGFDNITEENTTTYILVGDQLRPPLDLVYNSYPEARTPQT